jgi:hypothetical protein
MYTLALCLRFDGLRPVEQRARRGEEMKGYRIVATAIVPYVLFSVSAARAETWSCAVNEKIGGV